MKIITYLSREWYKQGGKTKDGKSGPAAGGSVGMDPWNGFGSIIPGVGNIVRGRGRGGGADGSQGGGRGIS